jgi:hypothetical protein
MNDELGRIFKEAIVDWRDCAKPRKASVSIPGVSAEI